MLKTYKNRYLNYHFLSLLNFLLVSITLPFYLQLNSIVISCLVVLWCWGWLIKKNKLVLAKLDRVKYILLLFFIYVISLSYSSDVDDGIRSIETRLSLLIFPMVIATTPNLTKTKVELILISFSIGVTLACMMSYIFAALADGALYVYTTSTDSGFHRDNYTDIIGNIHPTYFSYYIIFSVSILLVSARSMTLMPKYLTFFVVIFLLFNLTILASKSAIVFICLFFLFFLGRSKKIFFIKIAILIITCVILVKSNEVIKYRFTNMGSIVVKKEQWIASTEVILKNPAFGVGIGDKQTELIHQYLENGFTYSYSNKYNSHNEYLSTCISAGLIGLSILLTTLGAFAFTFKMRTSLVRSVFILSFSFACLTENMLSINKGAIYFSFFYTLLILSGPNLLNESKRSKLEASHGA